MRDNALVLLMILGLACGCSSTSRYAPDPPAVLPEFNGLPAPSELPPADSFCAGHSKATSSLISVTGDDFDIDLPYSGADMDTQRRIAYMTGQYRPLTFCIYRFHALETGSIVDAICINADWQGSDPPEHTGLYLAVPDWDRNTWNWFAFQGRTNAWHTIEDGYTAQGLAEDFLAVVNYSNTDVAIQDVHLEVRQAGEVTDDAWLYYTEPTSDGPDTYTSIWRVNPSSAQRQEILNGDATLSYSRPYCAALHTEPELFFMQQASEQYEEIGRCELDGSGAAVLLSSPDENIQPAGFKGQLGIYVHLRQNELGKYKLYGRHPTEGIHRISLSPALDACWDPSGSSTFSALYVTPNLLFEDATDIWFVSVGTQPDPSDVERVVLGDYEEQYMYLDPSTYMLAGNGMWKLGFMFAAGISGEGTRIYRYPGFSEFPSEPRQFTSYPGRDLRYPVLSPDGRWLAYLRCEAGEETGELLVSEFALGNDAVPILVAGNATGRPSWYDPTP